MSTQNYSEFHARSQKTIWDTLNRFMGVLIALSVVILIACAFVPELNRRREQAGRVEQLKGEIEKQKLLLSQRTREADLLQNDPSYVELLARDRLDMMKPGETIFRIETQPPAKALRKSVQ